MNNWIEYKSIESELQILQFTFVRPGEAIGHGVDGIANVAKVVCVRRIVGALDGAQKVTSASTLAQISGRHLFAPFVGSTLSKHDSRNLGSWVRHHLALLTTSQSADATPPEVCVTIQSGAGGRYANIKSEGSDLSVRMIPGLSDPDSLMATAVEWREKARRYELMADKAEAAAAVLG